jgi:glycosyltransferase involved in cell wall biosynthesis
MTEERAASYRPDATESMSMDVVEAKVAWVTLRLGRNGNLLYMGPLLKGISKACKAFRVFTVEFAGDCNGAAFDITCAGSIRLINQGVTPDGVPTGIPLVSPAIMKEVFRYKPDLLILNEFGLLTVYGMLLSLILRRARTLLVVENCPVAVGSSLSKAIRRRFRRVIARNADAILTNNSTSRSYLIEQLGVDQARIISRAYLVSDMSQYNGLQEDSTSESAVRRPDDALHFLYVGRLIQLKGLHHALKAFHHLKKTHPGRFMFDIVGDGPDRSALEAQTRDLELQDHVCFHGHQRYDFLAKLYRKADVFLFPTLMDYRSLVCFEAMSIGLPILASIHDGGSVETVQNGENGFTFNPLDHEDLAELMSRFIDQPALIGQFSAKSRVMAKDYTLPRAIEAVVIACNLALAPRRD